MGEINSTGRDGAEGQLALWAVTSNTTEARARQWSASDAQIAGAKEILQGASVQAQLNAPAPSAAAFPVALVVAIAAAGGAGAALALVAEQNMMGQAAEETVH